MDADVLVAGAGPTGLTLALDLVRRGVDVRIVDKADRFSVGSRGDGLSPRTLEVFEDLGVLDDVISDGMSAPLTRVYAEDQVVWEGRTAEPVAPRPDVPYPNVWFVPQWRTEQILRSQLAAHGVQVELSAGVVAFDQDEHGHDQEGYPVAGGRQDLRPLHAVRVGTRFGTGGEMNGQEGPADGADVGEHVSGIGQEGQRMRHDRRRHLEGHEGHLSEVGDRRDDVAAEPPARPRDRRRVTVAPVTSAAAPGILVSRGTIASGRTIAGAASDGEAGSAEGVGSVVGGAVGVVGSWAFRNDDASNTAANPIIQA